MHCQGLDFKVNLTYCNVKHKKSMCQRQYLILVPMCKTHTPCSIQAQVQWHSCFPGEKNEGSVTFHSQLLYLSEGIKFKST